MWLRRRPSGSPAANSRFIRHTIDGPRRRPRPAGRCTSAEDAGRSLMSSVIAEARVTAIRAAVAGGRILRHGVGHVREIKHKGEIDLVTEIDVASETEVVGI